MRKKNILFVLAGCLMPAGILMAQTDTTRIATPLCVGRSGRYRHTQRNGCTSPFADRIGGKPPRD